MELRIDIETFDKNLDFYFRGAGKEKAVAMKRAEKLNGGGFRVKIYVGNERSDRMASELAGWKFIHVREFFYHPILALPQEHSKRGESVSLRRKRPLTLEGERRLGWGREGRAKNKKGKNACF